MAVLGEVPVRLQARAPPRLQLRRPNRHGVAVITNFPDSGKAQAPKSHKEVRWRGLFLSNKE
ncbi:MAG: hypothetical protein A3J76_00050 [Candidatus Moranbacteria bacterium RBG_13_45_13]|nr:MAG: hypothetical protein A3J76_00050 [Candidatus Moranbacteria bacterium RBG_13_45_13]